MVIANNKRTEFAAPVPVLLTTEGAAKLLCVSPATLTVDRCRRRWQVPYLRVGRAVRYDQAAVLAWLAARNPAAAG